MKVKFEKFEVTCVSYQELEKLIKNKFKKQKNYNFVRNQECGNDTYVLFEGESKYIDKDFAEQWQNFKNGEDCLANYAIIHGLVKEGFLPKGKILVEVCW